MGGQPSKDTQIDFEKLSNQEKDDVEKERKKFQKIIDLISVKINERFKNLLSCFRAFDTDHQLSLTLNEFAQGIEHLRIKLSFEQVKRVFKFMDKHGHGHIGFEQFKMLD